MSVQQQEGIVMAPVVRNARITGLAFVNDYYKVLVLRPELLYKFYKDWSMLSRPAPNDHILKGTAVVNQHLTSLDYGAVKVEIKTVDSQPSYNNGVFVLVSGLVTFKNNKTTPFTQSFFLAPQENGYFVLNDIFRYEGENSDQPKKNFVLINGCIVEQHAARSDIASQPVFKSEAVAQDLNSVIKQPTTVVEETAPVLEKVHMQQKSREVPEGSTGQKVSAIEHVNNEGPSAPAQGTPVLVQHAPEKYHASMAIENAASSTVAVEKLSLGIATARVVSSSAQSQATNSTSSQPKASSTNEPLISSAANMTDNSRVLPSAAQRQATSSTSSQPKASSANEPLSSSTVNMTDRARVVPSSAHSQASNSTSSHSKASSANEPFNSSAVNMTDNAKVASSSAQSQSFNSTSSQSKASSVNEPLISSAVHMTDTARVVPSSAQSQTTNSTSSQPNRSSANKPSSSTTVNRTEKARVVPSSAHSQATYSTSSQPKACSATEPLSSSTVNMTEKRTGEESGCAIFIDNLPVNITTRQVEDELKQFGAIKPSGVQVRSRQGDGGSYAFVEFEVATSVQAAIEATPTLIGGRQAFIRKKRPFREGFRNDGTRGRGGYFYRSGRSDFMNSEDRGGSLSGGAADRFYEKGKGGRVRVISSSGLKPRI